jgi:hypothetical protein
MIVWSTDKFRDKNILILSVFSLGCYYDILISKQTMCAYVKYYDLEFWYNPLKNQNIIKKI